MGYKSVVCICHGGKNHKLGLLPFTCSFSWPILLHGRTFSIGFELQKKSWWKPSPTFSVILSWIWSKFLQDLLNGDWSLLLLNFWRAFQVLIGSALFYMGKLIQLATIFFKGRMTHCRHKWPIQSTTLTFFSQLLNLERARCATKSGTDCRERQQTETITSPCRKSLQS